MAIAYDLRPVSHITVDTIGEPGQRVFYLQASRDSLVITLIIEKEQALALVTGLDELFADLPAQDESIVATATPLHPPLQQPVEPLFRAGQMGLAYEAQSDLIVLVAYQLTDQEPKDVPSVRFWCSRNQMHALRDQALLAIEGGRPQCPLCSELIESDGHLCPRQNGHGNKPAFEF